MPPRVTSRTVTSFFAIAVALLSATPQNSASAQYDAECVCPQYLLYYDGMNYVHTALHYYYDSTNGCSHHSSGGTMYYAAQPAGFSQFCANPNNPAGQCIPLTASPGHMSTGKTVATTSVDTIDASRQYPKKDTNSGVDATPRGFRYSNNYYFIKSDNGKSIFWAKVFIFDNAANPNVHLHFGFKLDVAPNGQWEQMNEDKIKQVPSTHIRFPRLDGAFDNARAHHDFLIAIIDDEGDDAIDAVIRIPKS